MSSRRVPRIPTRASSGWSAAARFPRFSQERCRISTDDVTMGDPPHKDVDCLLQNLLEVVHLDSQQHPGRLGEPDRCRLGPGLSAQAARDEAEQRIRDGSPLCKSDSPRSGMCF